MPKIQEKNSTLGEQFLPASKTQENNLEFGNLFSGNLIFHFEKDFLWHFCLQIFSKSVYFGEKLKISNNV